MNKVQSSPWIKAAAAVLFLVTAFGAGVFAIKGMLNLPYVLAEDWQATNRFYDLLQDRQDQLAELYTLETMDMETLSYPDRQQYLEIKQLLEKEIKADATWFRFQIRSADGQEILYTNLGTEQDLSEAVDQVYYSTVVVSTGHAMAQSSWGEILPQEYYDTGLSSSSVAEAQDTADGTEIILACGVPAQVDERIQDEFYRLWSEDGINRGAFERNLIWLGVLSVLCLICVLCILWSAGHKEGTDGVILTWQERIFFDLYLAFMIAVGAGLVILGAYLSDYLIECLYYQHANDELVPLVCNWLLPGVAAALTAVVVLVLRTLTVRLKNKSFIKSTLLCRLLIWIWRSMASFFCSLPITWRVVGVFIGYSLITSYFLLVAQYSGLAMVLWWAVNLVTLLFLSWWSVSLRKLRQGTRAISAGDMEHRIDTARMPRDLRLQAEDLNNISVGMTEAVKEQMKSERFKAELITNVSHDLKTPLTSIINYVNLLKTTEQTDPTAITYIEVLDRKSQRLKKLTEDLVEASKASTGMLSVTKEKIGLVQLMDQAMGEWEERLQERKLTVVSNLPEGESWVYADGRHLWRVVDNLLSNCAKYAMEGTRIYVDLVRGKGQVSLSIKNISREALNVPAERLMERFVRGDESRTTEGSGLGLSIARSLTELQGGQFSLAVDGDLFKATVTLPQAN